MLRSATKQTRRVLSRVRTNPRIAHSVRHQSAGGTEGALLGTPTPGIVASFVGIGGGFAYVSYYEMKQSEQRLAEAAARHRFDNTRRMFDEWIDMSSSRKAVLHKRYNNSDGYFNLHKLIAMGDRSTVDQSTPAAESFVMVIDFFLKWEYYDDNKTIDSAQMKKYIGPEFKTIHKVLTEIRDEEEFKSRHQIDSDKLSDVLRFLDKMSKMETER